MIKASLESVMLVDDNLIDNFVAERMIEITGFAQRTILTSSVVEALEYLNAHEYLPENLPRFIFLDINMPLDNGFDFLEKFGLLGSQITSKCKVVILSSSDYKEDVERIITNHYVTKFLTKPLSEEALEEIGWSNV